ncbi:ShlB/FhaC/HecB family hemolysin secretion/activation protein [Erwinia sp. AnSW2-5]|uniref:ShlB/FhaC/HecB family hemolysin secretion/activation protein n=1 Tax=Erwinia sp. AnSW2-5 TaxID=3367692 RepID=UPI00385905A0
MKILPVFQAILISGFTVSVACAALPAVDQNIIEQRQKALLSQEQQQRKALRTPLTLAPLPALRGNEGGPCQRITQIVFLQAKHLPARVTRALAQPRLNRCMTLAGMEQLRRDATNAYLQRGYVTSQFILPPQDLTTGVLTLAASEGRIESITLKGQQPLRLRTAFPGMIGHVLNLRDIEQGLEQLNRLPSQQVTIDIRPGKQPGYSALLLQRASKSLPFGATFSMDNSGQHSTGSGQLGSNLRLDNPLQLGDQWQLAINRSSDFSHSRRSLNLNGSVTLPYGYWLLSAQGSRNDQLQQVSNQGKRWRYQGENVSQRLNINRTLWRDGQRKLSGDAGISHRRITSRMAGEKLRISSPTLSVLHVGGSFSMQLAGGYLTISPLFNQGIGALGATPDRARSSGAPRSQFRKFSLSSSYLYPITDRLSYLTSASGQTTPDNLYASERLSIGGQYSVRGYKEQYLSGNRGAYWRNELNWHGGRLPLAGEVTLTAALDGGWLQTKAKKIDGGTLSGCALGIATQGRWVGQSLSVAKPLSYPERLHPDRWVAYWQLGISL